MGYIVNPVFWLKTESDRVEQVILLQKYTGRVWTAALLQAELVKLGMQYTVEQVEQIGAELIKRGVIIEAV